MEAGLPVVKTKQNKQKTPPDSRILRGFFVALCKIKGLCHHGGSSSHQGPALSTNRTAVCQEHTWAGSGTRGAVLTLVIANKFMVFDTLVKHSPVGSKKHAAVPSVLIEEFENRFQDGQNGSSVFNYHCFVN